VRQWFKALKFDYKNSKNTLFLLRFHNYPIQPVCMTKLDFQSRSTLYGDVSLQVVQKWTAKQNY